MAPQVLIDVNHFMSVMEEESFGPVVGIMSVSSDEEAIVMMNDSYFGLTASIWTKDEAAALEIADQLDTGTVFMNRCDYLDPHWLGLVSRTPVEDAHCPKWATNTSPVQNPFTFAKYKTIQHLLF